MSTLREEYAQYKKYKENIIDESAEAWVQKNVILVNERIDRKTVNRLTNSIMKFDEEFGPFKAQLPAIQAVIDQAEEGLRLVLTGRTSDTRASEMLKKLSFIYSLLTGFFSADLPVLLRTPVFSAAKAQPTVRLDSMTGPGGDIEDIKKVFENALRPTKEELKLYHKVYKGIPMPHLKASEISQQLLGLSYNDLVGLTGVEKVPMVVTQGPPEAPKDEYPEPTDMLEEDSLTEAFLNEAVDPQKIGEALGKLEPLISQAFPGSPIEATFKKLRAAAQKALVGSEGLGGAIKDWIKNPAGVVLVQAQMAIDAFTKVANELPKYANVFKDGGSAEDLKKVLVKKIVGGTVGQFLTKIGNVLNAKPFPGLTPQDIINAVVDASVEKKVAEQVIREASPTSKMAQADADLKAMKDAGINPDGPTPGVGQKATQARAQAQPPQNQATQPGGKDVEADLGGAGTGGAVRAVAQDKGQNTGGTTASTTTSEPSKATAGSIGGSPTTPTKTSKAPEATAVPSGATVDGTKLNTIISKLKAFASAGGAIAASLDTAAKTQAAANAGSSTAKASPQAQPQVPGIQQGGGKKTASGDDNEVVQAVFQTMKRVVPDKYKDVMKALRSAGVKFYR